MGGIKSIVLLFLALLMAAANGNASDKTFELRGITFSSDTSDVERLLNIECKTNGAIPGGYLCKDKDSGSMSKNRCWIPGKGFDDLVCAQNNKPVSGNDISVYFGIIDNAVGRVFFEFSSEGYGGIKQAFISKYGGPDSIKHETMQTRMGAVYENEILEWKFSEGVLSLEKYRDNAREGGGAIRSNQWNTKAKARYKRRKEEMASDL